MDTIQLPTLGYFKNGNGYLGSAGLLRFQIEKPREGRARVVLWQGPFSRPYAQEFGQESFDIDEPGLAALADYLTRQAEAVNAEPPYTEAETTAFYQERKAQEKAEKEA